MRLVPFQKRPQRAPCPLLPAEDAERGRTYCPDNSQAQLSVKGPEKAFSKAIY